MREKNKIHGDGEYGSDSLESTQCRERTEGKSAKNSIRKILTMKNVTFATCEILLLSLINLN